MEAVVNVALQLLKGPGLEEEDTDDRDPNNSLCIRETNCKREAEEDLERANGDLFRFTPVNGTMQQSPFHLNT